MSHNGIWGGDLEINAISNYYKCNVIVFQDSRPNLEFQRFPKENRVLQLAYFGSCHYNSVRSSKPIALSERSTQGHIVMRSDEQERKLGKLKMGFTEQEKKFGKSEMDLHEQKLRKSKMDLHEQERKLGKMKTGFNEQEKLRKSKTNSSEEKKSAKPAIEENQKPSPIQRNLFILEKFRKRTESTIHHSHEGCTKWCGDLSFDDLVTIPNRIRIIRFKREKQVVGTLKLLTMKCPCKSGSYFKYCCYPKIKSWYV